MPSRNDTLDTSDHLLVDAVFGGSERANNRALRAVAWLGAIAAHVGLFFLAQLSGPSLETWSARVAAMVHHDLNAHAPTSIETAPQAPPAPPPPPTAATEPPPPPAAAAPRARAATPQPRAAPAQAANLVAAEPVDTAAPVDLTDNTFVTGSANAYAGGATATHGTGQHAVERSALEGAAQTQAAPTSAAQPVSLTGGQWHCPWPTAALAEDLYEQAVIVRALVRPDGTVENASVVADPGYGFGAAAVACALRTRFNPARNARGEAVRALSPPIRVRFTR